MEVKAARGGKIQLKDSFVEVHRRWPEIQKPGAYLRCTVVSRCCPSTTSRIATLSVPATRSRTAADSSGGNTVLIRGSEDFQSLVSRFAEQDQAGLEALQGARLSVSARQLWKRLVPRPAPRQRHRRPGGGEG